MVLKNAGKTALKRHSSSECRKSLTFLYLFCDTSLSILFNFEKILNIPENAGGVGREAFSSSLPIESLKYAKISAFFKDNKAMYPENTPFAVQGWRGRG